MECPRVIGAGDGRQALWGHFISKTHLVKFLHVNKAPYDGGGVGREREGAELGRSEVTGPLAQWVCPGGSARGGVETAPTARPRLAGSGETSLGSAKLTWRMWGVQRREGDKRLSGGWLVGEAKA